MVRNAFIISDIHLGASTSLLTAIDYDNETGKPIDRPLAQALLEKLFANIRELTQGQPIQQCVLLGDIFDFSFASYGLAMQNGRWFFEQLVASGLFEEYIYIPGNHDHHLWQQIIEHYYLMTELDKPPLTYPKTLPANFVLNNTFLDKLLPDQYGFQVTYPNYELSINNHVFYLHHGHFLQKLYIAASQFLEEAIYTKNIEDLEALNAPFLEFGWYNIGQAYNIGKQKLIDKLYFMFKNNKTKAFDRLVKMMLEKIDQWNLEPSRKRWNLVGMASDSLIKLVGPYILKRLFFKQSRLYGKRQHASTIRHTRLAQQLDTTVMNYMRQYLLPANTHDTECTFIFGHTHEPEINFVCMDENHICYHIYNTGGWIVDRLDESNQLILPQMEPLYISEDGSIHPIPFTEMHTEFIKEHLESDSVFQEIKQALSLD